MLAETLETLFKQYGYILVVAPHRYHAFKPEDIQGDKVRAGACPVMTFTWHIVPELTAKQAEEAMRNRELLPTEKREPFDITEWHRIGLSGKSLPEWHGWPIEELRKMLGIDK